MLTVPASATSSFLPKLKSAITKNAAIAIIKTQTTVTPRNTDLFFIGLSPFGNDISGIIKYIEIIFNEAVIIPAFIKYQKMGIVNIKENNDKRGFCRFLSNE